MDIITTPKNNENYLDIRITRVARLVSCEALTPEGYRILGGRVWFLYSMVCSFWNLKLGESFILRLPKQINPHISTRRQRGSLVVTGTPRKKFHDIFLDGELIGVVCDDVWRAVMGDEIADQPEVEWILPR